MSSLSMHHHQLVSNICHSVHGRPIAQVMPKLRPSGVLQHPSASRSTACSAKADSDSAPLLTLDSAVPALSYAAMIGYVVTSAPNQTPLRDQYFIEKLVGLGVEDGVPLNPILVSIFFLMGVYPVILAALGTPSLRSANKVPLWPFVSASFAAGVFAIFPYLIFWQPTNVKGVPDEADMTTGVGKFGLRATESKWLPLITLVSTMALLYKALYAGVPAWNSYFKLFDESKFIHLMTLDFCALTALTPFFLYTDAEKREWGARDVGVPALSFIPLVGPLLYLILRPKAAAPDAESSQD
eukprot:jgi/Ulvmu1/251/UM001_0255.1